ncbi:invasin, partial [Kosakonia cowanii]
YTAAYRAITAGTGLRATVRLPGWSAAKQSEAYAITATAPDRARSGIATDKRSYTSGEDMTVTVTLKDARGNAVTGVSSLLTAEAVTAEGAVLKTGSGWKDNGDGTYTAAYRAITAGTDLRAAVRLPGWSAAAESGTYIIYGTATLKDISVNGHTFRPDEGFPTTGFKGAEFTLRLASDNGGSTSASDYTWTADAPWVSVTDGVVRFTGKGTGNKVTITGTPKSRSGTAVTYSFMLKGWFINNGSVSMKWTDADAYCRRSGLSLPTVAQMTNNTWRQLSDDFTPQKRAIGSLWSEWGDLTKYSGAGFSKHSWYAWYWSSEQVKIGYDHYVVYLDSGSPDTYDYSWWLYQVCRQGF